MPQPIIRGGFTKHEPYPLNEFPDSLIHSIAKHIIHGGFTKHEPYPLNEFPDSLIHSIAKHIIHRRVLGLELKGKIFGHIFAEIFAQSIKGEVRNTPLGIVDVG